MGNKKKQFLICINICVVVFITSCLASPRFYYNYSLKTRNPPTVEPTESPYTTTQWRWLQPQANNDRNFKVVKTIYKKNKENFYHIFYSGTSDHPETPSMTLVETTTPTIPSSTTPEIQEITPTISFSTTTSTLPPSTPKMDSPMALSVTTESKPYRRNRLEDPLKMHGIPKELMPIMPGGGSRFDDVEKEKIERKKMSQTKGTADNTAENGGSHEAEGLYSSGSLAPFYLLFYSFIPILIFNRILFGS